MEELVSALVLAWDQTKEQQGQAAAGHGAPYEQIGVGLQLMGTRTGPHAT
jgi:hypothetical protein